jgi:hypothetical protein
MTLVATSLLADNSAVIITIVKSYIVQTPETNPCRKMLIKITQLLQSLVIKVSSDKMSRVSKKTFFFRLKKANAFLLLIVNIVPVS